MIRENFYIGNVKLNNNVFLAPLAGVTDKSFRILCKEMGAGLVVTEMISSKGVFYNNRNTLELFEHTDIEKPISVQIFGSEPDIMADAAKYFEQSGADIIDINMGCPTPKITAGKSGSYLMTEPALAGQIIEKVARAVSIPVTVKIRRGYKTGHENACEIAKIAEEAGCDAIAVHGRYADQFYSGHSDWEVIKRVKETVRIPVVGNGDIKNAADAKRMFEETNCDAIMIGRGALGNPWIFKEILSCLKDGHTFEKPSKEEVLSMIVRQLEMTIEHKGEYTGLREMRKHIAWYLKGYKNSSKMRDLVFRCEDKEMLIEHLNSYFSEVFR
ncbi:MAG: tRNA dihydrouridine synthase DusB [Clostridiaceae bacterium]|jgi:tRNA-dihydrouridine synthase B|nr:tRNA dihydrouridine synthase DusB [Clostridiaceae bacterium]